ncbi:hypothetical protein SLEP1_g37555 [Rubroshorea leprosula]|uniref:DUF674 domain-containing protein n=1 Tax=Rubroshorea leprosula TaxID=152421 RepID=A0AAV5KVJ9_9ROSI|nr:hypothetical protein SLEP1_g37555 [Rubroshorea leprosula]
MADTTAKVSLRLLVDKKAEKVLFAEANKDFVDFLFNLLSLPIGTVIRLLSKHGMVGCLGNLYESVETLNDTYMQASQAKDSLLKPEFFASGEAVPLLLPNIQTATSTKFYKCPSCGVHAAYDPTATCPRCGRLINSLMTFVESPKNPFSPVNQGGFVKGVVTYMVMDNLEVKPMSTITGISMLNRFNVKEIGSLEDRVVDLGMDQGVKLLKASLQSKNVLTDVFLGRGGRGLK